MEVLRGINGLDAAVVIVCSAGIGWGLFNVIMRFMEGSINSPTKRRRV